MAETLQIQEKDNILYVEFNINEKNSINRSFIEPFIKFIDDYENRTDIRVAIFSARGDFFSNGFDPQALVGQDAATVDGIVGEAFRQLARFIKLPFITIAAITGHAMGFGAIFAINCDYRFMTSGKARIGFPEAVIGLALPVSTALVLQDLIGQRQARDLAITGKGLKPQAALEIGLVDELYEPDELLDKTEKFAKKLASGSNQALTGNKLSLRFRYSEDILKRVTDEDSIKAVEMILHAEGQEGLTSITEGRRARFD